MSSSISLVVKRNQMKGHSIKWPPLLLPVCLVGLLTPITSARLADSSGKIAWLVDLASHWQWLYLVGLVLTVAFAVRHDRRWGLALLAMPLPWFTASDLASLGRAGSTPAGKVLSVASANVHLDNRDPTALERWLNQAGPDVVVLHEISADYAVGLERLQGYPYRKLAPSDDPFGVAVLSRYPFARAEVVSGEDGTQSIEALINWGGQPVALTTLHPMPPISPRHHNDRNLKLRTLAKAAGASSLPAIVVGDLNATPWSNAFSGLGHAGLLRATGLKPTWPAIGLGWMGIPIDHVLVTPHWSVMERQIGPNIGSDHLPVMVRIGLISESG